MMTRFLSILALAALLLGGCNKSPSETAKDVGQAREKAATDMSAAQKDANKAENKADQKVAAAQQDYAETKAGAQGKLNKVEADAMVTMAKADFDVAMADLEGRHLIATKKCGMLKGVEKTACLSTTDAALAADQAIATANRDAILVQAERQQ